MASVAYDAAKTAARLAKAKQAHDQLISAVWRAQADALVIEAQAKRRLADEYDAAQERGEVVGKHNANRRLADGEAIPTASDIGLTYHKTQEYRQIRDAEAAEPDIVRRAVDEAVAAKNGTEEGEG
jgi:hypothetical protein